MRIDGGGTKKLLVAFQFRFSNRAAWDCDDCRKRGLVSIRHCAFAGALPRESGRPVWVRGEASALQCPKSLITAESLFLIEQFDVWKRFGCADVWALPPRVVEAIAILDDAWQKETANGSET